MISINNEQKNKLEKIAIHYAEPRQIAKAIEETSELQKVLAKYLANGGTYKDYKKNLGEELAGVIIMLEQIVFLEGVDEKDISEAITFKINRQLERIKNDASIL